MKYWTLILNLLSEFLEQLLIDTITMICENYNDMSLTPTYWDCSWSGV